MKKLSLFEGTIVHWIQDIALKPCVKIFLYQLIALLLYVIPSFASVPEALSGFRMPIDEKYYLGYDYLEGPINYGCLKGLVYHPGVDLNRAGTSGNGDRGTDIKAVADGVVRDIGTNPGEWGTIVIEHNYKGTTVYSQYGHLDSILVRAGEPVKKGDHIGEMGNKETTGSVKSFMQIFLKVLFSTVSMVLNYAAILSSFDTLIAARIARASFVILTPYHLSSLSCQ